MRSKNESTAMLKRFRADVSTFLHANGLSAPCTIRTDNGTEYLNSEWATPRGSPPAAAE